MRPTLRVIANLLSIRPGEGGKTLLLYALVLIFFLGLAWGDAARESLFLTHWSPDDLASMFILNAILGVFLGLVYASFADRINNSRLLYALTALLLVWLLSVRIFLETNGGPRGLVYPYFYISFVVLRDLATLHLVTFINDFFDTRAAKRLLPLLLSAGVAGSTLAGFSGALLNHLIGVENVPLAWGICLLIFFSIQVIVQRRLGKAQTHEEQIRQPNAQRTSSVTETSAIENLRQGFDFVLQSRLLRWMALAAFLMMIMLNLLFFQSSRIFVAHFANDRTALFNFYNLLGGLGNITALLIQSLLLSRLVTAFGVGAMNLLFPAISLLAATLVNLQPSFGSAIFTRLGTTLGRQVFRNPFDTMLYNSLPIGIKTRARGFVASLVLPLGTLIAGLIIVLIQFATPVQDAARAASIITAVTVGSAAAYLLAMLKVRQEYGLSLASLFARDDLSIFHLSSLDTEQPDPATMELLYQRMRATPDDRRALLIAEMVYQIEERGAFPELIALARQRSPSVRTALIQLLAPDWISDPGIRRLCLDGLGDLDPDVQHASAQALLRSPDLSQDTILLEALGDLLRRARPETQALVIPTLIRYALPRQQMDASACLAEWLTVEPGQSPVDRTYFALAVQSLAAAGDSRLQAVLESELSNAEPTRRMQCVAPLSTCLHAEPSSKLQESGPARSPLQEWSAKSLTALLSDASENIRLAAFEALLHPPTLETQDAVWSALGDPALSLRRLACQAADLPQSQLEAGLVDNLPFRAESCALLLSRHGSMRAQRRLLEIAEGSIRQTYAFHQLRYPLHSQLTPPRRLLDVTLREAINAQLDRLFGLLTGFSNPSSIEHIRRALAGPDPIARANAAEALDALTSPAFATHVIPLLDNTPPSDLNQRAISFYNLPAKTLHQTLQWAWPALSPAPAGTPILPPAKELHPDGLLICVAMLILREDASTLESGLTRFKHLLHASQDDALPLVRETATRLLAGNHEPKRNLHYSQDLLADSAHKDGNMLSLIEKILFLQEVPFFKDMPLQELRILAGISEEKYYQPDEKVFSQGDATSSLYVIISGKVAVQQQARQPGSYIRLSELGPRDYFAEVSLFDEEPHAADILALEPTDLLVIRRATLVGLVRNQPEIGLTLLKALSQRLRQTYADMNAKTQVHLLDS